MGHYSSCVLVCSQCPHDHADLVPYGNDTLNNSPLDDTGSDFPCKKRTGVYDISQISNIFRWACLKSLASSILMSTVADLVRPALYWAKSPQRTASRLLIHSIIGGCPSNAPGNLGNGECPDTFNSQCLKACQSI